VEEKPASFEKLSLVDRIFNSAIGALVSIGIGLPQMRVLEVRGRKSGKLYRLPVDLLPEGGKLYLVAPRGRTQWVRNAEASGTIVLRRDQAQQYSLRALAGEEKQRILAAYLTRFRREVQRFFPLPAGSPAASFAPLASRYPAFELTRAS
jgi:deazaflavin-dependent oxidoreductase (nitroreductase family)